MVKAQASAEVHLISDEDDPGMSMECTCTSEDMSAFAEAFRVSNTIGASAIKREAVQLNNILLQIHQNKFAGGRSEERENRTKKRQHYESKDAKRQSDTALDLEESEVVWKRVKRVRRMAIYLKNAQFSQQLFLGEMAELTSSEQPKNVQVQGHK
jgi:hypothetical protein